MSSNSFFHIVEHNTISIQNKFEEFQRCVTVRNGTLKLEHDRGMVRIVKIGQVSVTSILSTTTHASAIKWMEKHIEASRSATCGARHVF